MPHFFRHVAPKIASKLSLSRSSDLARASSSFVPVRAGKVKDWKSGMYESSGATSSRGMDDYMELGESNTWQEGPTKAAVVRLQESEGGRHEGGGGPVAHLPRHVTSSIYEYDYYPRAASPHLLNHKSRT